MSNQSTTVEDATDAALFRLGASKGGKARAARLSPERRSEIARQAAEARWLNDGTGVQKAHHTGALAIGAIKLECAVLEDGTRVLSQGTMLEALGRAKSMGRRGTNAPFVSAANLEPYISEDLRDQLEPITYKVSGQRFSGTGYRAETLVGVCEAYLAAREDGNLQPNQLASAQAAEVLIRSLAKVGIIALVDEATGYQAERATAELQRLLEQFVSEEFRPWVRMFPEAFFSEIYRLYGWEYKEGKTKHPQYVGRFINAYIYDHLPEGVADELRRVNPRRKSGHRPRKHHQHLTVDTGNVALDRQITTVTTLMQVSRDLDEFKGLFQRRFPQSSGPKVLHVRIDENDQVHTLFELQDVPDTSRGSGIKA